VERMAEMLKNAPEISSFFFKTNDAGAGICWSYWLYTGPNGATKCKDIPMGERVRTLLNTFQDGASKAGRKLAVYLDEASSNFSDEEKLSGTENMVLVKVKMLKAEYHETGNRMAGHSWWQNAVSNIYTWFRSGTGAYRPGIFYPASLN